MTDHRESDHSVSNVYLTATGMIDSDHPDIRRAAADIVGHRSPDAIASAIALYYFVRDHIRYDPYRPFYRPDHYRASNILRTGVGYCVAKAVLLCALARVVGIPARLGFATVRNHLATRQMIELMGSDLFVYHGFSELFLCGHWVKATPAFNADLCKRFKVAPLEFDGLMDAVLQPYNSEAQPFMEYLEYHGAWADVPLDNILNAWRRAYGAKRVDAWIEAHESGNSVADRSFDTEDIAS